MSPEEKKILERIEEKLDSLEDRSYTGDFTAFAVFIMFVVFALHGCSFK